MVKKSLKISGPGLIEKTIEARGSYSKDKKNNKLVKKARESDVRRHLLDAQGEKHMKSSYQPATNKEKRKSKMIHKKIDEDYKREARRDER